MIIDNLIKTFGSRTKALEILYLLHEIKPVVRQGFYENELSKVKDFCLKNDLAIETSPYKVILSDPFKRYSNKGLKVKIDYPRRGMFFVYISKDQKKAAMAETFEYKNDHRGLGLILGYPDCCVDFFVKNEPERSRLDNDYTNCTLDNSEGNKFPLYANTCKRHMDLTLLNHFPCSFKCTKAIGLAKRHFNLLNEIYPELAKKISEELKCSVNIGKRFVEFY